MTYYCIADGYTHRKSSMIGRDHIDMKITEDFLDPFKVACGVSIVIPGTSKYKANTESIMGFWDVENFNQQFDRDPMAQLQEWKKIHLIGFTRHSGRAWWELLAGKTQSRKQPTTPERFSLLMRKYASSYGRIESIEVPQGFIL